MKRHARRAPSLKQWLATVGLRESEVGGWSHKRLVTFRDRGVCCRCGLDTEKLIRSLIRKGATPPFLSGQLSDMVKSRGRKRWRSTKKEIERQTAVEYQLHQWGQSVHVCQGIWKSSLCDTDHVIACEVYTGDPEELNAMANLQTLCIPCHRAKSNQEHTARARRRKNRKRRGPKERQLSAGRIQ